MKYSFKSLSGFFAEKVTKTTTFRQSLITTVSTFANAVLGALFYFFLARFLGAEKFGVFTLSATTIALISSIFDFGSDQGLVRFVPKYKKEKQKQKEVIKISLFLKIIFGFAAIILASLGANFFSAIFFKKPGFSYIFPLIGVGVLTQLLFSFSTSLSQAFERFFLWGGLLVGTNLTRFLIVLLFLVFGFLSVESSIFVYILIPLFGFLASLLFFERNFLFEKISFERLKEIFSFNKWVFAFVLVAAIGSRLDFYFSARFLNLSQVGIYGLALQVVSALPQLTSAIGVVTSPKFSSFSNLRENISYTKKTIFLTSFSAFLASVFMIPASFFVFKFSGQEYLQAFSPFLILLLSMALFLATSPIRDSIIYFFGKPEFFFFMGIFHLLVVSLASIFMIPKFGILGSALSVFLGQILIAVSSFWYYQKKKEAIS